MSDLPSTAFPAHAANRSIYLGQIYLQIPKSEVAGLLAAQGIDNGSFWLYWDTRLPPEGSHHLGCCFVEFRTRELAVLAWARLNGLFKWGRTLVVGPVHKPGALRPSHDELNAALQQQPASPANPPPQAPPPTPPAPSPSVPTQHDVLNHEDQWAFLGEFYSTAINTPRSQGIDLNPGGPASGAPKGRSDTDNTSPAPGPNSPTSPQAVKDIWSDPSLLETIRRNAEKVWPGWGGYGPFQARPWRLTIDPSEVQALNWHGPSSFLRFVSDDGKEMHEIPTWPIDGKKERIESLWFLLAQASGQWTDEELREKEKKLPSPKDVGL